MDEQFDFLFYGKPISQRTDAGKENGKSKRFKSNETSFAVRFTFFASSIQFQLNNSFE